MSILSDYWIRNQCTTPGYRLFHFGEFVSFLPKDRTLWDKKTERQLETQEWYIEAMTDFEVSYWKPMISPYHETSVKTDDQGRGIASYGTSSYGYDIRSSREWRIFTDVHQTVMDYKNFDERAYVEQDDDICIIPPNGFVLARSVEYIRVPDNVTVLCTGKSTIARAGISVLSTPLEAGWEGYITLEFANTSRLPAKLYANEGSVQLLFLQGETRCLTTYAERGGKYNRQGATITLPKV